MEHEVKSDTLVVDPDGVELGFVSEWKDGLIEVSEGPFGELLLEDKYVREEGDRLVLAKSMMELLEGLEVFDFEGVKVGTVEEAVVADGVLDSLVVKEVDDRLIDVVLEDIFRIGDYVVLDITKKAAEYEDKHPILGHLRHSWKK